MAINEADAKAPSFPDNPVYSMRTQVPTMTINDATTLGIIALGVARQGFVGLGVWIVIIDLYALND